MYRVDPAQSAAEKAAALALSDDYRMQEKDDKRKKKVSTSAVCMCMFVCMYVCVVRIPLSV